MNKNKIVQTLFVATLVLVSTSCKDQLDVGNPNAPTQAANVNNESGIISQAQGAVYINGFLNGDGWLGNSYFSLPMGYNELLSDNVGASASNNQVTTIAQPDYLLLADGSKKSNPSSSTTGIIRTYNTRAATGAGNNAIHYQWLNMYALINGANLTLSIVDDIPFPKGDAVTKIATIKAWCYFWKGFAYASIGTKYYAGLIINEYGKTNSDYVSHDVIINESNNFYNLAATTLGDAKSAADYDEVLGKLIPAHCQTGNGGVPSVAEWKRQINTLLARNIIFNKMSGFVNGNPSATISKTNLGTMTAADWTAVKTLVTDGVQKGDVIFVGYTTGTNDFFSASGGTVAALTANPASTSTFKISERVIQNFKAGDARLTNNFSQSSPYSNDYVYGTRFTLINGGKGTPGVTTYASRTIGEHELIIAGSYEENALMLAEANMRTGNIDAGTILINDVRTYLGAGIAPIPAGLSLSAALTELTMERRTALLFRGLSYYDQRRWGWMSDISVGGGSYGNTVVQGSVVNTGVTICYNFMDYWDVPANEVVLNPPSEGSVAVVNPNY